MLPPPPRSTRTDTLFPDTTLFRSLPFASSLLERAPTRGYGYGTSTAGDYLGGATLSAISPDWSRSRTVAGLPATARASPPPRFGGSSSNWPPRSEEHTSELQSLMRISYAVFCLKKKKRSIRPIRQKHKSNTHLENIQ